MMNPACRRRPHAPAQTARLQPLRRSGSDSLPTRAGALPLLTMGGTGTASHARALLEVPPRPDGRRLRQSLGPPGWTLDPGSNFQATPCRLQPAEATERKGRGSSLSKAYSSWRAAARALASLPRFLLSASRIKSPAGGHALLAIRDSLP